ncbi:MAG: TrmH family RNA methyltransferase [Planctomycetota bacterium]
MKRSRSSSQRPPSKPIPATVRHQGKAEEKYHGIRACEALFARRPQDIIRVYILDAQARRFKALLDSCTKLRRGFQVVAADNLARVSGSMHHEGIVILARACPRWDMADLLRAIDDGKMKGPLLYLDGVQNPHNLGAILRTAAHFGSGCVLGGQGDLPPLSSAAVRVAEGAAEYVPVCELANPPADLARLRDRGYSIVASSSHGGLPVFSAKLGGKIVLVLGAEGEGVSKPIAALANTMIQIPGTGVVESLNVSVACGVLLAEICRGVR